VSATLGLAWREQRRWSLAANRAKGRYLGWGAAALLLSIAAAGAATASTQVREAARRPLAAGGTALLGLVALIRRVRASPERQREWIRARSASEGLKTEAYQYVMRVGPYREGDAHRTLSERVDRIIEGVKDISAGTADLDPATSEPPADPMPLDEYLEKRVRSQIDRYYRKRARSEARKVAAYRQVELGLTLLGMALGVWAAVAESSSIEAWGAVVTTAIAAVAAHLAAGRHEYQVMTYTATALQLERLSARFQDSHRERAATPAEIDTLVTECEAAISVENQGWMTQWEKPAS
jgi:hypothetical protein